MVRTFEKVGGKYGNKPASNNDNKTTSHSNGNNPKVSTKYVNGKKVVLRAPKGELALPKSTSRAPRRDGDASHTKHPSDHHRSRKENGQDHRSRREITAVTMNMNGKGVMGFTPKYKVNMIQEFLSSFPDVVFFQDSIEYDYLTELLENASDGRYDFHFQELDEEDERSDRNDAADMVRSITGVAWNKTKYFGTPLQLDDDRLDRQDVKWLRRHDVSVVRLESRERSGMEDVYPSMIAISWYGADYETPLRQRTKECEEFFSFLAMLREKNWHIPILIGGDFNMDMKSFSTKSYPDFVLLHYRPVSGTLAKDLKNTFMYTMDSLQVTETGFKQQHPEIFPNPFISAKVRGRNQIRIWAVVRIQRCVRRWLRITREREHARRKLHENKKRWKKKIRGSETVSDDEDIKREYSRRNSGASSTKKQKKKTKDRRYALYWDEADESDYQPEDAELDPKDREHRRRKSFTLEGSKTVMDDIYNSSPQAIIDGGHRRKKYDDLKSVQEKREEERLHKAMGRHYR